MAGTVVVAGTSIATAAIPVISKPHAIAAGHHTIELVAPDTGQVIVHRSVEVTDGMKLEIAPP